jgi:colanic acid/amylovoran biosynthesis glycosyltransferase
MGEDSFVGPELPHLVRSFGSVVVVPAARGGARATVPDGVKVDESLAIALSDRPGAFRTLRNALACAPARDEMRRRGDVRRSAAAIRRLLAFAATATRVSEWYSGFAARHGLGPADTVLYSYWLDALALGLSVVRARQPSLVFVSRGHRVDVFEREHRPPYLPCRKWLLGRLDRLFLVSEDGRSYVTSSHPEAADRAVVSRLGTPEPGFRAAASTDGILRVVSCSAFLPIKRVDVLAEGFVQAARSRVDRRIEWDHFGSGPLQQEIETWLGQSAPPNLRWAFHGHVSNDAIFARYRSQATDLFANSSESEGIPVSIMEAQSCGIPVMAPSVGGVPEAVSPENGLLMPAPVRPPAVAEIVSSVLSEPGCLATRRIGSRQRWEERFRAERNFTEFAETLRDLRERSATRT